MEAKFISRSRLGEWLGELQKRFSVWAPRYEGKTPGGAIVYRPFDPEQGVELDRKPTESAKAIIFPRSEALINYRRNQDAEAPGKPALQLEVPEGCGPQLVFGLLPCDARGFLAFDPVYDGSGTEGVAKDIYYQRRRADTILIAKACSKVFSTCFCNWVGGAPASTEGADALATEVGEGFIFMPITAKGEAVLDSALLSGADEAMMNAATASHKAAEEVLKPARDVTGAVKALIKKFEDDNFWQVESAHCLSCGACTYLCPTCYCFNMTDESAGMNGVRLRSWDSCMAPLFTLEASGHNPRAQKAMRLKNRVGHKFSYYPKLHSARIACVGCGRCIKSCPSGVDIRRIVTDATGPAKARKAKADKE